MVEGILALGAGRLVSLGSVHATPGNFTMSDHEEENAILTDKGKENDKGKDADRSSDRLLTARMDLMLQSMQQM